VTANVSDVWHFKKDHDGRWNWQKESLYHDILQEGRAGFPGFDECVADAKRSGYTGSAAVAEEAPLKRKGRLLGPKR